MYLMAKGYHHNNLWLIGRYSKNPIAKLLLLLLLLLLIQPVD
jgi:hypothetical protein